MAVPVTIGGMLPEGGVRGLSASDTYVGIDFGTSTTVVSMASVDPSARQISVKTIPIEQKFADGTLTYNELLPSAIAVVGNIILVGEGAAQLKYTHEKGVDVFYSFKMELGESAEYPGSVLKDAGSMSVRTPKDAAQLFFGYLKSKVVDYCAKQGYGANIHYAVSIPASFEANQRQELVDALAANGMAVSGSALIDEPNAAFLSYVHKSATSNDDRDKVVVEGVRNPKVMVFDFGAGTCDISILEVGKGAAGFYSKNIAISKFTSLGGDDLDRYIAFHFLLPQLLRASGKNECEFRKRDKRGIVSHLLKIAETLKIMLCKHVSLLVGGNYQSMPAVASSDEEFSVQSLVSVDTKKGLLECGVFSLSCKQFAQMMKDVFLKDWYSGKTHMDEGDYCSVLSTVKDALRKAHLKKDDVDYVLFIGGSSNNPYVVNALANFFAESDLLFPADLQKHVSRGAALHSLVLHTTGRSIVKPIMSEPIIVVAANGTSTIFPAGQEVPCAETVVSNLVVPNDGQRTVELPVCVSNDSKMLFNVKIESDGGFRKGDKVLVKASINTDKLLTVVAECAGRSVKSKPVNPDANKELTTEEREVIRCEREFERDRSCHGGTPSLGAFRNLVNAYEEAGKMYDAADTEELQASYYGSSVNWNSIGLKYSDAGRNEDAMRCYQEELRQNPNDSTINFNIALLYDRMGDKEKYAEHMTKAYELDTDCPCHAVGYASMLASRGEVDKAQAVREKALADYQRLLASGRMHSWDYSWFASLAWEMGKKDLAQEVREAKSKAERKSGYDAGHLAEVVNNDMMKL